VSYTGLWKATAGRTEDAEPLGHPEYAEQHMRPGRDDVIGSRPPYPAPHALVPPTVIMDDGMSYDSVLEFQAPAGTIDQEPTEDHSPGDGGGSQTSYEAARATGNRLRSVDRNAGRSRLTRRLEVDGGQRETKRLQVDPSGDIGTVRAMRGKNSLPENNPDGYRVGQRVQRWYQRPIPMHYRHHELRVVRTKLADSSRQNFPPAGNNRYSSPFANIVSGRKRTQQGPVQRRTPRPWDELAVADTSAEMADDASAQGLRGWGL
jgi:hypothetical protein